MSSIENVLLEFGVLPLAENKNILEKLLKNWRYVEELKKQANFWVRSVDVHDVEEEHRVRTETGEKVSLPGTDLDNCSVYSGDTESEQENLRDVVCKLFHDTVSANRRYETRDDLHDTVVWELDLIENDKEKLSAYRAKNAGNYAKLRWIDVFSLAREAVEREPGTPEDVM